jgi:hypothetical protein
MIVQVSLERGKERRVRSVLNMVDVPETGCPYE